MALDASPGGCECMVRGSEWTRLAEHPTTHPHVLHSMEHTGGHSENFIVSLAHGAGAILATFDAILNNDGTFLRAFFDE